MNVYTIQVSPRGNTCPAGICTTTPVHANLLLFPHNIVTRLFNWVLDGVKWEQTYEYRPQIEKPKIKS